MRAVLEDRKVELNDEVCSALRYASSKARGGDRMQRHTQVAMFAFALLASFGSARSVEAAQVVLNGPVGSGVFGARVTVLPNGNFVVIDNEFDAGPIPKVGAVYLYRADGVLISTLQGSNANDQVGNGGVTVLDNGNFVIRSSVWRNGTASNAGAVTFASSSTGVEGTVSASNSLVGTKTGDSVGSVTALRNGNYVVSSSVWDSDALADVGAVTWGSGIVGVSGAVSTSNSLIGSRANDQIGQTVVALNHGNYVVQSPVWDNGSTVDAGAASFGLGTGGLLGGISTSNSLLGTSTGDNVGSVVTQLSNGNYVVQSPAWDRGAIANAGAASFATATEGITGTVSSSNSLVGDQANDQVGAGVTALSNGHYVVRSSQWRNGAAMAAGAITFASGVSGITGSVTASNSLIGSSAGDTLGSLGVTALSNGNYVVSSPLWNNGALVDAGAVTLGSGTGGIAGLVSPGNSLIGSQTSDQVGSAGITALSNGNYVVRSPNWDNGAIANVGAATFGSGVTGANGVVSSGNSLIGSAPGDSAESRIAALSNGNYVVSLWRWDNGAAVDAGAATWGSGVTGISGVVSVSNSLVGSSANDQIGSACILPLSNGNYVVCSPNWDSAGISNLGAATFAWGTTGLSGAVTMGNSLIGSLANDQVGASAIALSTGDYVVLSPFWDADIFTNVGAATFASGLSGISGEVTALDSLVGSASNDQLGSAVGIGGSAALANGQYVIRSPLWNNGAVADAGAITLGLADGSALGPIIDTHSVIGVMTSSGFNQVYAYDPVRNQLIVGDNVAKRVILHRPGIATSIGIVSDTPDPSSLGEAVHFTAEVSASSAAPSNGQVRFQSSSGEACTDSTPTPVSANTASFSCNLIFNTAGTMAVQAEYTDSLQYAYSGIAIEQHTVSNAMLFANGFE